MVERNIDVVDARGSSPLPPIMTILSIETSCDETAVSIVRAANNTRDGKKIPTFDVRANLVLSQIKTHAKYGGVFPAVARREHAMAIAPLIEQALLEAKIDNVSDEKISGKTKKVGASQIARVRDILHRDPELAEKIVALAKKFPHPAIDLIAVTYGPGLEPALWIGLTVAQALSSAWNIPLMPINHMEGHIVSVLYKSDRDKKDFETAKTADEKHLMKFPAIALLISGGHTELVLVKNWAEYEIIGETRDDAVGEAFDKVARMLGLPYPGGPEISRLAATKRQKINKNKDGGEKDGREKAGAFHFPRPMLHTADFDFSFSGLKTSVLYTLRKLPEKPDAKNPAHQETIAQIAKEFEDAVTEVLVKKTMRAAEVYSAKSLIIAGGVAANKFIRKSFEDEIERLEKTAGKKIALFIPESHLSTDNALMIAICAYIRHLYGKTDSAHPSDSTANLLQKEIRAVGNARLGE